MKNILYIAVILSACFSRFNGKVQVKPSLKPQAHITAAVIPKSTIASQTKSSSPESILCNNSIISTDNVPPTNSSCHGDNAALRCFHDPIYCQKRFPSGKRELDGDRPQYGEYSYLKHENWFRVLQHGGIAFLFHPCTSDEEKENLRNVASQCLHRYIMAPYAKLTMEFPIALVSWGCFYLAPKVNVSEMKSWIMGINHTYQGPASHVRTNGDFQENLLRTSEVLTNKQDQFICPTDAQKNQFIVKSATTMPKKKVFHGQEAIINRRLELAKHKRDRIEVKISANVTLPKVETGSAVWAAGSLLFLCGILVVIILYTKLWSHEPSNYKYNRLQPGEEFEYEPGYSQFSLLKSSQKFMSIFRTDDKNNRKLDSMSKMNLMMPINEEEEDEETVFQR